MRSLGRTSVGGSVDHPTRKALFGLLSTVLAMLTMAALLPISAAAQPDGPTVRIEPSSGPPGAAVTISGTGFGGDCGAEIWIDLDSPVLLGSAVVDEFGRFSIAADIPTGVAPGTYPIRAVGQTFAVEFCTGASDNEAATRFTVVEDTGGLIPRFVPEKPTFDGALPEGVLETEIHLKFVQGSGVRLVDGAFVSPNGEPTEVTAVLAGFPEVGPSRLFDARSEAELADEKRRVEARSGREQGDKNLYYLLTLPEPTDEVALLNQLNALGIVEIAYPVPTPGPDPSHDDYQDMQGYRLAAGSGIHADAANSVPGGSGENVQVIDIERYFNPNHEDLPAVTLYPNGDIAANTSPPYDHGTAVMGQIFGQDNGFGVLGIAHEADAGFVSTAGGRPNAIDVATANSAPGDVILLELQRAGANGGCTSASQVGCVPEEYVQASYDAIVAATGAGIIVVAAAGNGSENLDAAEYQTTFGDRPDSGAIIVGAGAAGADDGCNSPERGRLGFSTFGSRVNLQGWGECVTTLGYGNLEGSSDSNDAYSAVFSGTSSASPIVASAAAVVSSVAIQNGDADGLTSTEARALLVATGTPQDTSGAANPGNIGPLPNLAAALGLNADVSVTKTADPDPAVAGEPLTYELTVTNNGPNIATDVELVDDLPAEVTFVSADAPCVLTAGDVVCELGTLEVGATVQLDVVVDVPADLVFAAGAPVTITNTATVEATIDDEAPGNDATALDTTVVAVADLEVASTEVVAPPVEALIGDDIVVKVRSTVANGGPSTPMNADLEAFASPSAGASATPASDVVAVSALAVGNPQVWDQLFTVSCDQPGVQSVVFDTTITPANAADTDPNPANDTGQASFELECIVPIAINVRPGNQFNRVNLDGNGVIPVAALTTEAGEYGLPIAFDATLIEPDTVRFGESAAVYDQTGGAPAHNGLFHVLDTHELDDKTKDGDDDMRFGFRTSDTGLDSADTEACMRGEYLDGGVLYSFFGCDVVDVTG